MWTWSSLNRASTAASLAVTTRSPMKSVSVRWASRSDAAKPSSTTWNGAMRAQT